MIIRLCRCSLAYATLLLLIAGCKKEQTNLTPVCRLESINGSPVLYNNIGRIARYRGDTFLYSERTLIIRHDSEPLVYDSISFNQQGKVANVHHRGYDYSRFQFYWNNQEYIYGNDGRLKVSLHSNSHITNISAQTYDFQNGNLAISSINGWPDFFEYDTTKLANKYEFNALQQLLAYGSPLWENKNLLTGIKSTLSPGETTYVYRYDELGNVHTCLRTEMGYADSFLYDYHCY